MWRRSLRAVPILGSRGGSASWLPSVWGANWPSSDGSIGGVEGVLKWRFQMRIRFASAALVSLLLTVLPSASFARMFELHQYLNIAGLRDHCSAAGGTFTTNEHSGACWAPNGNSVYCDQTTETCFGYVNDGMIRTSALFGIPVSPVSDADISSVARAAAAGNCSNNPTIGIAPFACSAPCKSHVCDYFCTTKPTCQVVTLPTLAMRHVPMVQPSMGSLSSFSGSAAAPANSTGPAGIP